MRKTPKAGPQSGGKPSYPPALDSENWISESSSR